jgi:hypothetical protein
MTESRFKRRKLASREHASETMLRESIRRQDLLFLDEIALAVIESETADHAGLALRYRQVGGWLLANYSRLDLRISVFELRVSRNVSPPSSATNCARNGSRRIPAGIGTGIPAHPFSSRGSRAKGPRSRVCAGSTCRRPSWSTSP